MSNRSNIIQQISSADLVIGAVLITGKKAPKLITRDMLQYMQKGTVICDVAVDQGGCFETTKPTTHAEPTYLVDGIVHYCVANMPGAVPLTSTYALTNVTLQYVEQLAQYGEKALLSSSALQDGLNVYKGSLTCQPVAEAHELVHTPISEVLDIQ